MFNKILIEKSKQILERNGFVVMEHSESVFYKTKWLEYHAKYESMSKIFKEDIKNLNNEIEELKGENDVLRQWLKELKSKIE